MTEGSWARARTAREGRDHQTRTAVIDAAALVFAEHGYARTSMGAIAEAAGVARPTVYLYFGTKAEVFRALTERVRDQFLQAHEIGEEGDGPREIWRISTEAFLTAYRDNGAKMTVIEHQALVDDEIRALWIEMQERPRRRMINYIRQLSDESVAHPVASPEAVGDAVIGMISHVATLLKPDEDITRRVDDLVAMHMVLLGIDR